MNNKHLLSGWTHFWRQVRKSLHNPIFFVLTILGNGMVFGCATLFLIIERGSNPNVNNFGDAVWWAFVTVTSVGYGDTVPLTPAGRMVAVFLMLTGGVLFLSFIALLSSAFIELEFQELGREVRELRKSVDRLIKDKQVDSGG